jgi:hypothetical protein
VRQRAVHLHDLVGEHLVVRSILAHHALHHPQLLLEQGVAQRRQGLGGLAVAEVGAAAALGREQSEDRVARHLGAAERGLERRREGLDLLTGRGHERVALGRTRAHRGLLRGLRIEAAHLDARARRPPRLHHHVALLVRQDLPRGVGHGLGHDAALRVELRRLVLAQAVELPADGAHEHRAQRREPQHVSGRLLHRHQDVLVGDELDLIDVGPQHVGVVAPHDLEELGRVEEGLDGGVVELGAPHLGLDLSSAGDGAAQVQRQATQQALALHRRGGVAGLLGGGRRWGGEQGERGQHGAEARAAMERRRAHGGVVLSVHSGLPWRIQRSSTA